MKALRYDKPYNVSWTITVQGRTQADGKVIAVTSTIVRDKIQAMFDQMLTDKKIEAYDIKVTTNNKL